MGPRGELCGNLVRDEPAISYSNRGGNSSDNGNVSSLFTVSLIDDLILLIETRAFCYSLLPQETYVPLDVVGRIPTIPIRFKLDLIVLRILEQLHMIKSANPSGRKSIAPPPTAS